jgi:uncharacterized pyridoxal phosphate-containing UPF0001 family protein
MAGNSNSGRKKGVPNKATQEVVDKLKELNCDPIEGLARIAQMAMDEADLKTAKDAYKELAQYVAPKRKAIEIDADITIHDEIEELTDEELLQEMKELGFIPPES